MTHSPMSQNRVRDALRPFAVSAMSLAEFPPPGLVDGNLYVACKNEGVGTGWSYRPTRALVSDLHAALAALTAPPASDASGAEGWKLVPVEPTQEMARSAYAAVEQFLPKLSRIEDDCHPNDVGLTRWSAAGWQEWEPIAYRAMLAAAPTAPAQAPSRPVDAGGVEDDVPLAEQAKHHGRDWKVWWHGSGQRGDHIMEMSQNGFSYGPELAYLGADFHDAAGRLVAAHNEQVRRLREVIARQAVAKTLLQKEISRLTALATQAPDKAGAREGVSEEHHADLVSLRNHLESEGHIHDADAISAALKALATQPPGTEARRPVGGEVDVTSPEFWKRRQAEWLLQRDGETDAGWIDRLRTHFATPTPPQADSTGQGDGSLTLTALHAANIARQAEWCPEQVPDLSFRGNELAGETGEACNVIKKLERERQGWRGSRATPADLAEELADVVICADLCAVTAGIDLSAAVVAKFNATSDKVGISVRLPVATPSQADAQTQEGGR